MLTTLSFSSDRFNYTFPSDMVIVDGGSLIAFSISGPAVAVTSFRAWCSSDVPAHIAVPGMPQAVGHGDEWTFRRSRLGNDLYRLIGWSKTEGVCMDTDDAIFAELNRDAYTTPILREWVPWIATQLRIAGRIDQLHCFGCKAIRITCDTDDLDRIVSAGLRHGALTIGAYANETRNTA